MKRAIQIVLALVIVALVWVIFTQIKTPLEFNEELAQRKGQVIERIKDIREAQRAYKRKTGHFTASFDSLIDFVLNDSLVMTKKKYDEDDSIQMAKLKKGEKNIEEYNVAVIDTIFKERKLTPDQVKELRYIPCTNRQREYVLSAGIITTESKVVIPVVECVAPYIYFLDTVKYRQAVINLIDDEVNNYNKYPGVKFGSMETGNNEAGNWE